jgi:hypothetical protein
MDDAQRKAAMDGWRRRCKPMPAHDEQLRWQRIFSAEEWQQLCRGVPLRMENKWFIFVENLTIHCHRSWTGYCIYQVAVRQVAEGYAVQQVTVNRDPEQYRWTDNKYDLALLDFLISNLLLGQQKPFPLPPGVKPAETPGMGILQHYVAGTGYPETT